MQFSDARIAVVDLSDAAAVYRLIVEDLCGEKYYRECGDTVREPLVKFLQLAQTQSIDYEQFNELLLLAEQDRVSRSFYKYFFSPDGKPIPFPRIRDGIIQFRGFAILCFGNFRFAYRCLRMATDAELTTKLRPFCVDPKELQAKFKSRPRKALTIEKIPRDRTWCLGYISKNEYEREATKLAKTIKDKPGEMIAVAEQYEQLGESFKETEKIALRNTDVYLSWDYMDIYIATSMRRRWEFEDTADVIDSLFADETVRSLQLRYFDPTQSKCGSRIDKGLVEGLMLKRALCTIYMVQESDTMGKDSELASTLAQGKPVIAYVPSIEVESHSKRLQSYPLDFFKIRFQMLTAEGVLEDPRLADELAAIDVDYWETIDKFVKSAINFRHGQPFSLWRQKDDAFKTKSPEFERVCKLLATAERFNFARRATTLRTSHPLSFQVHLESGVANGVLVVTEISKCAELVHKLLTNSLEFIFEFDQKEKCTVLREKISGSPFRVVTEYEKLSNSFWNFYLN